MFRIAISLLISSTVLISCCGTNDKYSDMRDTISEMSGCYEDVIKDLQNAKKGKDVAKALNKFTDHISPLMNRAKDLEKKYPDFNLNQNGGAPREIESEVRRYKKLTERFISPDTMKKVMKFSQDPDVIKAQQHMIDTIGM
ncbi:MAG TPA: hypothetical protein PKK43_00845 [Spirochaetota bacterium]|nr:hypothetical protein [Spirochaetota bacterium]